MIYQTWVKELQSEFPSLQFSAALAALAMLVSCNRPDYETVWDVSNRVCDRLLESPRSH